MEPITVKTSMDFKTYFKIGLANMFSLKKSILLIAYLAFLNAISFWGTPFNWNDEFYILGIAFILFFVVFPVILWLKCKWIMKKHPMFLEELTYQIDKDNISYTTASSSSSSNWKYITKAKEIDTHFLLYVSGRGLHFLSKNGFTSTTDVERFKEMVKANNIVAYFK